MNLEDLTFEQLEQRLTDDLRPLTEAKDAAGVAAVLAAANVRGRRRSGCECPVATYLKQKGWSRAEVSLWIFVFDLGQACRIVSRSLPIGPVTNFITEFDAGIFPGLVQP